MHPEFQAQPQDEILEQVWSRREEGDESLAGLLQNAEEDNASTLVDKLAADAFLRIENDRVVLTAKGEERASSIIRGHRLAKRLLYDVLNLPAVETEKTACLMEHVLGTTAADAVCTFLGHPLASAVAVDVLARVSDGETTGRAAREGAELLDALRGRLDGLASVVDVRGLGLLLGIELEPLDGTDAPPAVRVAREALQAGLIVLPAGNAGTVVELTPPLGLTPEQVAHGVEVIGTAVEGVFAGTGRAG